MANQRKLASPPLSMLCNLMQHPHSRKMYLAIISTVQVMQHRPNLSKHPNPAVARYKTLLMEISIPSSHYLHMRTNGPSGHASRRRVLFENGTIKRVRVGYSVLPL